MNQEEFIEENLQKIGERIRELRIAKGYTNYEHFAYENGFSRAQYFRYEKGQDLRVSTLLRLIMAFEISPEEFFKDFA